MTRLRFLLTLLLLATVASRAASQEHSPRAAPAANAIVGAPSGPPLVGEPLDATTKEVASLLRCPVCQGSSVWDSPATMAVNMKHQVRDLAADGYSRDQILGYFQNSYGDFVLLSPPKNGIALLVWILPPVLLIAGAFIVGRLMSQAPAAAAGPRSPSAGIIASDWPERDSLPADPELAQCVLTVRELAYGTASKSMHRRTDRIVEGRH
jgi:cytochrome c-type biogenesis protein CcmH